MINMPSTDNIKVITKSTYICPVCNRHFSLQERAEKCLIKCSTKKSSILTLIEERKKYPQKMKNANSMEELIKMLYIDACLKEKHKYKNNLNKFTCKDISNNGRNVIENRSVVLRVCFKNQINTDLLYKMNDVSGIKKNWSYDSTIDVDLAKFPKLYRKFNSLIKKYQTKVMSHFEKTKTYLDSKAQEHVRYTKIVAKIALLQNVQEKLNKEESKLTSKLSGFCAEKEKIAHSLIQGQLAEKEKIKSDFILKINKEFNLQPGEAEELVGYQIDSKFRSLN